MHLTQNKPGYTSVEELTLTESDFNDLELMEKTLKFDMSTEDMRVSVGFSISDYVSATKSTPQYGGEVSLEFIEFVNQNGEEFNLLDEKYVGLLKRLTLKSIAEEIKKSI